MAYIKLTAAQGDKGSTMTVPLVVQGWAACPLPTYQLRERLGQGCTEERVGIYVLSIPFLKEPLLLPSLASLNYTVSNTEAGPSLLSPGLGWPLSQSLLFVFYCSSASVLYFTDPSSPSSPPAVFLLHTHPPPLSLLEVSPGVLSCLGRSCNFSAFVPMCHLQQVTVFIATFLCFVSFRIQGLERCSSQ